MYLSMLMILSPVPVGIDRADARTAQIRYAETQLSLSPRSGSDGVLASLPTSSIIIVHCASLSELPRNSNVIILKRGSKETCVPSKVAESNHFRKSIFHRRV